MGGGFMSGNWEVGHRTRDLDKGPGQGKGHGTRDLGDLVLRTWDLELAYCLRCVFLYSINADAFRDVQREGI